MPKHQSCCQKGHCEGPQVFPVQYVQPGRQSAKGDKKSNGKSLSETSEFPWRTLYMMIGMRKMRRTRLSRALKLSMSELKRACLHLFTSLWAECQWIHVRKSWLDVSIKSRLCRTNTPLISFVFHTRINRYSSLTEGLQKFSAHENTTL